MTGAVGLQTGAGKLFQRDIMITSYKSKNMSNNTQLSNDQDFYDIHIIHEILPIFGYS
jgi:hypothetical protein